MAIDILGKWANMRKRLGFEELLYTVDEWRRVEKIREGKKRKKKKKMSAPRHDHARWRARAFTMLTRRGRVLRKVKEHYLRDDLGCGTFVRVGLDPIRIARLPEAPVRVAREAKKAGKAKKAEKTTEKTTGTTTGATTDGRRPYSSRISVTVWFDILMGSGTVWLLMKFKFLSNRK